MQKCKKITNSKHLVNMNSYDCLNLGKASCEYKCIRIILNQKWDT